MNLEITEPSEIVDFAKFYRMVWAGYILVVLTAWHMVCRDGEGGVSWESSCTLVRTILVLVLSGSLLGARRNCGRETRISIITSRFL